MCEVLAGMQQADGAARKAAEQYMEEAATSAVDELVATLSLVLQQGAQLGQELRQEAAVLLRQLVMGNPPHESVVGRMQEATQKGLMTQLLSSMEQDPSQPVRRNASQVASAMASTLADDVEELVAAWPELLPAMSSFISSEDVGRRVVALDLLKELVAGFGEGLMAKGEQLLQMLSTTLGDSEAQVRAASAQLVLQLIEDLEPAEATPLAGVMPAVVAVVQSLAKEAKEENLKETLQALVSAADEEPEFFRDSNILGSLWQTVTDLCAVGPSAFADPGVRQVAMEVATSLAGGLAEDFSKPEGVAQLERLLALNIEWMLEVEEDVSVWTEQGKDENQEDGDDDVVEHAEQNFDRLAEQYQEDVFMPVLFKLVRAAGMSPNADWKQARASVMAISQVVEHVEATAWVDQCVTFVAQNVAHPHPRVRYSAFGAVAQIAYDHEPHVQETHHALLLPAIIGGIKDDNIRVATEAVNALTSLADELDVDDLEPHVEELLLCLFLRLDEGETKAMQESCLCGIAALAEVMEELFLPYYDKVAPALKQLIATATDEKQRSLRGKAFECISAIGSVIGKETFAPDAHEVMKVMSAMLQQGFAADDPQRESVLESAGRIAVALEKEFKPYVPALLPVLFETLKQRPAEVDPADMPDEEDSDAESPDMSLSVVDGKVLGIKTSVIEEMRESLDLIKVFMESIEEEFCEFLAPTCQQLLPLLELKLSDELQQKAFSTWESLVDTARLGVGKGRLEQGNLQELVTIFLEKIVGGLRDISQNGKADEEPLDALQAKVVGVSGVVRKAGPGILTKDGVKNLAAVAVQLIACFPCKGEDAAGDDAMDAAKPKGRGSKDAEKDDEDEDEDMAIAATRRSLRLALADVVAALLRTNPDDFAEVALQPFMQYLQSNLLTEQASDADRGLAFYITDDVVECLGAKSIPYWNGFMTQALQGMMSKSALVRQYACSTIGNAAQQSVFAQMGPAATSVLRQILQKQGERHRRRKAVKSDAKQAALAVDACIRALGEVAEHHEATLGDQAGQVWSLWLANLPLRYDEDAGKKAHGQLLRLLAKGHPIVSVPQNLQQVVMIFAEVYKTKFSNSEVDAAIVQAVAAIGEEPLSQARASLQEKQAKKIDHIKAAGKTAAAA